MRFVVKVLIITIQFLFLINFAKAQYTSENLWLTMDDGIRLDVTLLTPDFQPPPGGFPAIVFVHGLGGSKNSESIRRPAQEFAGSGYVTLTYSVRGQGDSEGKSTVFATREQKDLEFIVDWLANKLIVNDTLIGVSGASQGGYHAWFAAVNRMNVRVVAPENSTPLRADAAARYGCYAHAITAELEWSPNLRLDTLAYPLKHWLLVDHYDSVCAVLSRGRTFDSTDVAASTARFCMLGAWHDHVFPQNRVAGAFSVATEPSFMYLGVGGHQSGISFDEALYREDLKRRFFAENLRGEVCGLDTLGPVIVSLGPRWNHVELDTWPPESQELQKFILHSDGTLSPLIPNPESPPRHIQHKLQDSSYTWTEAVGDLFRRTTDVFLQNRLSFISESITDTLRILGIPKAHVTARGTAPRFQINLQLYAESPEGQPTYLSQISLGQRTNPDSTAWHELSGEFTIVGWEIPTGYRLRVDWTSINETLEHENLWILPYWDADGVITLGLDKEHPTWIQIPILISGTTGIPSDKTPILKPTPNEFQLSQNIPNPFNPTTTIRFWLPHRQHVSLSVFDIRGREIATLMDKDLNPGRHSTEFNAKNLPSGVYFYRLTTPTFTKTKKMALMR